MKSSERVLVISSSTGNTAPGKVFSNLIGHMRSESGCVIGVVSNDGDQFGEKHILPNIHPRIRQALVALFGLDIFDYLAARRFVADLNALPKVVVTLMSANHFFPMYAGYLLKRKCPGIQWINYSVDAIPAPVGWGLATGYRAGLIRMIRRYMSSADTLCFSNPVMLAYQLEYLGDRFTGVGKVLYTITQSEYIDMPIRNEGGPFVLVYAGAIYQARRVDHLLGAFARLVEEGFNVELLFVGTDPRSLQLGNLSELVAAKVRFVGYQSDLTWVYGQADLLVDIDADIDGDVFISSKFFGYLMVNRRILCITRQDSPVDQLVRSKAIEGVTIAEHSANSVYQAIRQAMAGERCVGRRNLTMLLDSEAEQRRLLVSEVARQQGECFT